MRIILAVALISLCCVTACVVTNPMPPSTYPITGRDAEFTETCRSIWRTELGRDIDDSSLVECIHQFRYGRTGDETRAGVHESAEAVAYREAKARPEPTPIAPLPSKLAFVTNYQGDFGNTKLAGCGLYNDSVFDPILLPLWLNNRDCYERILALKGQRGDNRVVVSPAISYHGGQGGVADLWHDPSQYAKFLADIRTHTNVLGETIEPLTIWIQGEHFQTFLAGGEGKPSAEAEAHFRRDAQAMAAATQDVVPATAVCWECRHQRDYITPGAYARAGKLIAELWPKAWHGQHFIQGSSSASSWNCGDETNPSCRAEGDDPFRGSEPGFWVVCQAEGWCDGLLYQFVAGREYTDFEAYQNYTGKPGSLGRWWELVVRADTTLQGALSRLEAANQGAGRHGWVSFDLIAFEFIYDAYNMGPNATIHGLSTADFAVEFCRRALEIGGSGCGSASYRRGR